MPSTRITKAFGATATPGHRPSTRDLAPYNNTIEDILPKNLSENLQDVVAHIFPLSADPSRMQKFLDRYLNFPNGSGLDGAPPVYFKPAAPFVLLEIANYGRLSSNILNAGWFSQREIAFGMAVEWYARKGEDITFLKYALIYPYVYVDSELGIAGGREIYGWSKAPIEVALLSRKGKDAIPVPLAPVFHPPTEQLLLAANLVIPERTPEAEESRARLIEIRQTRYLQAANSAVPDMLTAVPRAISASLNTGWEALKFLLGSREFGTDQVLSLSKLLPQYRGMITKYLPSWAVQTSGSRVEDAQPTGSATSIITLKQVRDIEDQQAQNRGRACYQGILESQMRIERISDGGPLVDAVNPDPSAGIYIDLFAYNDKEPGPLELGMDYQVVDGEKSLRHSDPKYGAAPRRYRLVPFLPFWVNMDLQYGLADYQTWRTTWTDWTETNTPTIQQTPVDIRYVELGAGAGEEIAPPTCFPQVTMRILPLAADYEKITGIIDQYLDNSHPVSDAQSPTGYFDFTAMRFPKGSSGDGYGVVLAILSNFEGMETRAGNSTTYDDYEFTFAIPIIWKDNNTSPRRSGVGLVPIYTFAGTAWNAITNGEVYGRWTLESTFDSAPFTYTLPPSQQLAPGLKISTQLFPDKEPSEDVLDLPVVEVAASYSGLSQTNESEKDIALESMLTSLLPDIAMPDLVEAQNGTKSRLYRFHGIALKQVRDANDPQKADYQASVWLERKFIPDDLKWLHADMELHIPEYQTLSIAATLGLKREIYTPPKDASWPHAVQVYRVKPVTRADSKPASLVVSGKLIAASAAIGWWRIGKDGWKGPGFKPAGSSGP